MFDGHFETVLAGYATELKARNSAGRQGRSVLHSSRWRIVCDGGWQEGRILEAEFVPGKRTTWTVTQEAHK